MLLADDIQHDSQALPGGLLNQRAALDIVLEQVRARLAQHKEERAQQRGVVRELVEEQVAGRGEEGGFEEGHLAGVGRALRRQALHGRGAEFEEDLVEDFERAVRHLPLFLGVLVDAVKCLEEDTVDEELQVGLETCHKIEFIRIFSKDVAILTFG